MRDFIFGFRVNHSGYSFSSFDFSCYKISVACARFSGRAAINKKETQIMAKDMHIRRLVWQLNRPEVVEGQRRVTREP